MKTQKKYLTTYSFTEEEVKTAKAVRDKIINGDDVLKSIYMAGEIVMWDELHKASETKTDKEYKNKI